MRSYIAIVFHTTDQAYEGLAALWHLDGVGKVTVHGATVVHRDAQGELRVDTKETYPALATAVGAGIGVLLGLLAGPVGVVVGLSAGAGIGAAAGGAVGVIADLARADTRAHALVETGLILHPGQSAIIADVSEDWAAHLDRRMDMLGGVVHRRARSNLRHGGWFKDDYLFPYEFRPADHAPR